jgi:cytochrome c553
MRMAQNAYMKQIAGGIELLKRNRIASVMNVAATVFANEDIANLAAVSSALSYLSPRFRSWAKKRRRMADVEYIIYFVIRHACSL